MAIPNYLSVVADLAAQYPQEWKKAHNPSGGGPETEAFIRRLAWVLHQRDSKIGLTGKRGNPQDISDDTVCYDGESVLGDYDPTRGNAPVTVLDVIGDAGGANPKPQWGPVGPSPLAAWVRPRPVDVAPPAPLWTPAHQAIRARLGNVDTQTIAEQLAHSFPTETWGQKRADASRPISRDVIARVVDGVLWGIRVVPLTLSDPFLLHDQVFVPVTPVNHLGDVAPNPTPEPPPVEPPPNEPPAVLDLKSVLDAIAALSAKVDAQRQEVIAAVQGQSYEIDATAAYLGKIKGTIRPRQS